MPGLVVEHLYSMGECVDPDYQSDVDEMILDYLLYMATNALLEESQERAEGSKLAAPSFSKSELPLQMVDSYLPLFKASNSHSDIPESIVFRLHLLKFTTLFTRRLIHSPTTPSPIALTSLRQQNLERATVWLSHNPPEPLNPPTPLHTTIFANSLPCPEPSLLSNRREALAAHNLPCTTFYGTPTSPSLLETLPRYLHFSASVFAAFPDTTSPRSESWMRISAEYMLQSALEQYRIYGACRATLARECFAWGYDEQCDAAEDSDEQVVNAMFYKQEPDEWEEVRDEYMLKLFPPEDSKLSLAAHLDGVAREFPLVELESKVVEMARALNCERLPLLVQLERGQLEGVSKEETAELLARVAL
ncbi:MAG: hypothetical protein M1829_004840 [Trizodia sp. TS-e1964]|nr:MAG: hypothetical protein M1829_004840 [Trizodia sp. TS-e1964]